MIIMINNKDIVIIIVIQIKDIVITIVIQIVIIKECIYN